MAGESTTNNADTNDPLARLPSELVLRIIDNATLASVAKLSQLSRAWNNFIEQVHQDAVYSSLSKVERPPQTRDFSFVDPANDSNKYYNKYYNDIQSWKDLCRRQTLLKRRWNDKRPTTREANIQVGDNPIWRFRPDFKRRIFISTSQMGGFNVTDMDSGDTLFQLKANKVRPFAHLEYADGTAVFDRPGNAVEVWKTHSGLPKGVFEQVSILHHDAQTRGFQLRDNTLCVVSSEGKGYIHDLSGEPMLLREIDIEDGAVGHLDQGQHVVAYAMGAEGYHFYDKKTGDALGILHPEKTTNTYHVVHPTEPLDYRVGVSSHGRASDVHPPKFPSKSRMVGLCVKKGKLPERTGVPRVALSHDDWGAGMLDGDLFAGVSRGGRTFICSDWRKALASASGFEEVTANLECDTDGSTFDDGGWLAVHGHKLMFENRDRAYIIGLNDDNTLRADDDSPQRPSYAFATSSTAQIAVPISYMGIYDDCVMSTYTVSSAPILKH